MTMCGSAPVNLLQGFTASLSSFTAIASYRATRVQIFRLPNSVALQLGVAMGPD